MGIWIHMHVPLVQFVMLGRVEGESMSSLVQVNGQRPGLSLGLSIKCHKAMKRRPGSHKLGRVVEKLDMERNKKLLGVVFVAIERCTQRWLLPQIANAKLYIVHTM